MPSVRVDVLRIVDSSFPVFVECRLIDHSGKSHFFIDKLPIVADYADVPPCVGAARCTVLEAKNDTLVIDTSIPDDIEFADGMSVFEVNTDQVI